MGKERRTAVRRKVDRLAKVQACVGTSPSDCRLVDISDAGVRLRAQNLEIPDEFVLLLSSDEKENRACQVVWRLGFEIGAKFTDQKYAFDWSVMEAGAA
jgi:hypothetical protein